MKQQIVAFIVLLILVTYANSSKVRCEREGPRFISKQIKFSGDYTLTNTIYDKVNVFVDAQDATISLWISRGGSWLPRILRNMARFVKPGSHILNAGSPFGL